MGVFKWLRRDRISPAETVATTPNSGPSSDSDVNADTVRTPEYQRDLAQFFQRRSISTPPQAHRPKEPRHKGKEGRHSLPPACLCPVKSPDESFRYERKTEKSKDKCKRKLNNKKLAATSSGSQHEAVPNIQFLYSNQIFMPGTVFSDSQEQKSKKNHRNERRSLQSCQATVHEHRNERGPDRSMEVMHQIVDFPEDENSSRQPPPFFFKNNSLPYDIDGFLASPVNESEDDGDLELETSNRKSHIIRRDSRNKNSLKREVHNDCQQRSKIKESKGKMQERRRFDADNVEGDERNAKQVDCPGLPVVPHQLLTIKEVSNCEDYDWALGYWGSMPIHLKRKKSLAANDIKAESNAEMDILTMYRHPNLLLLMGISYDIDKRVIFIFEHYESSLFDSLHVQGKLFSAQAAIKMISDVANVLMFLYMQGYIHSNLSSKCIMLTYAGVPKLTDFECCFHFPRRDNVESRNISNSLKNSMYLPGPQYTSINDGNPQFDLPQDWEPLISSTSGSETNCLMSSRNGRNYQLYKQSGHFRWHAPEIFQPEDYDLIYPCARSDVYSLSLILWEICNAAIPWKSLNYEQLSDLYVNWKTGIQLPKDGSYPGCLLDILESGLKLQRDKRPDIKAFSKRMQEVQVMLDQMDPLYINKRVCQKMSEFSVASSWNLDAANSGTSLILNLVKSDDKVYAQEKILSSGSSSKTQSDSEDTNADGIRSGNNDVNTFNVKDDELDKYNHYFEDGNLDQISEEFQAFSTPGKTPFNGGPHNVQALCLNLHRSDSTEYCSLFSPEIRESLDCSSGWKHSDGLPNRSLKLNQSVTPRSYRPLEIKMPTPEDLENIKPLTQSFETHANRAPNYSFDIKNYSLPTTPIARSNKIRRNAWLAGQCETIEEVDLVNHYNVCEMKEEEDGKIGDAEKHENSPEEYLSPTTSRTHPESTDNEVEQVKFNHMVTSSANSSIASSDRDAFTGLKRIRKSSCSSVYSGEPSNLDRFRSRSQSWSGRPDEASKCVLDEELAHVAVKPLVEFHERWIHEANKKCGRSNSLPENYRGLPHAVKPASQCVDSLPKMRPFSDKPPGIKPDAAYASSVTSERDAPHSETSSLGKQILAPSRSCHTFESTLWKKENINSMAGARRSCSSPVKALRASISTQSEIMTVDHSMNTSNLEEFVQGIIRREFDKLVIELGDNQTYEKYNRDNKFVQHATVKVIAELNNRTHNETHTYDCTQPPENQNNKTKECPSHLKAKNLKEFPPYASDGSNSPLIQIMFNKSGNAHCSQTSLNLTVSDCACAEKGSADNANRAGQSTEDEMKQNSLKRCQAFSAIQEARSTEDLYIDDELSAHMDMEGLQGVKFIPLHSTLHEVLCDKDEDCCLLKMQEETGCDRMYLICDYPSEQEDQQASLEQKHGSSTTLKTIEEEPRPESLNNETKSCCRLVASSGGKIRKEECDSSRGDSKNVTIDDNVFGAESDILVSIDDLVPCSSSGENSFQSSVKSSEINEAFDKDTGTEKEINAINKIQRSTSKRDLCDENVTDSEDAGKKYQLSNDLVDKFKA